MGGVFDAEGGGEVLGVAGTVGPNTSAAGHVEIRTEDGFVSDYHSKYRCFYPLLAVYGKF